MRWRAEARRLTAILAVLGLFTVSCGSMLSDEERSRLIAARKSRGGVALENIASTRTTDSSAANRLAGGAGVNRGPAASTAGTFTARASAAGCPGGNVADQVGLTKETITLATIADVSGIQPGIFQGAHRGARAAAAYINSQGGICGRRIEPLILDSKTDGGGNRAATLDACAKAFALLGSMSAFDDGGARPGEECGIPDITSITTNLVKYEATNTYPVFPNSPSAVSTTNARYIAKRFPAAVKKAAILWLNIAVGKAAADARRAAWEAEGFEFIYATEVQILEANYTRYVSEMERRGVQYVHFIGDFQNMVRMQRTMRQQNYVPQVRDFDSITYDPDYLREPEVVEGSFTFLNVAPFEEPTDEMRLYSEWYQRASPGEIPDYFGLYAWSAYRLFQQVAARASTLTRKGIIDALRATPTWDGHGLHGAHRIGAKLPTTCNIYLQADHGRFKRVHPASGFDCNGKVLRRLAR